MGGVISFLFESVNVFGTDIPVYVFVVALVVTCIFVGCCYVKCCKGPSAKPVVGESFKWPNSSRFLKRVDPSNPPELVRNKYEDPIRTDALPEGEETYWTVKYQPNGERNEVTQHMYLCFRAGRVFGVGFEEARKLCKIWGKYKHDKRANQTALAFECKFSNQCDTIVFHGWGNGTGIIGNCYFQEINPFSVFSGVPGVRQLSSDKYKGSFLLLKESGMGESSLRSRTHTRRVHKWAGKCFPDESEPQPMSPMYSPGGSGRPSPTGGGDGGGGGGGDGGGGYIPVEEFSTGVSRSRSGRKKGGGVRNKLRRFFHRKKPSVEVGLGLQDRSAAGPADRADGGGEIPPWVRHGSGTESGAPGQLGESKRGGGRRDSDEDSDGNPQFSTTSSARGTKRSNSPANTLNYLALDGVPGRSGNVDLV
ncbi:unnamed protein product [Pylaiella littoralis]